MNTAKSFKYLTRNMNKQYQIHTVNKKITVTKIFKVYVRTKQKEFKKQKKRIKFFRSISKKGKKNIKSKQIS